MTQSNDSRIGHLLSHYDETCKDVKEQVAFRDRWFLFILGLIGISFFQVIDPAQSSKVLLSLAEKSLGVKILANTAAISATLWFLLLTIVVRYFQSNVYINRRYTYLHSLEKKINSVAGEEIVTREGKSYLKDYPRYSDWIHFLYTWIFPVCLLVAVGFKARKDWPGANEITFAHIVSLTFCIMIVISTTLYLRFLHWKK